MTRMDETTHYVLKVFTTALAVINALLLLDFALSKRRVSKWQIAGIFMSIIAFVIVWYFAVGQFRVDPHSTAPAKASPASNTSADGPVRTAVLLGSSCLFCPLKASPPRCASLLKAS